MDAGVGAPDRVTAEAAVPSKDVFISYAGADRALVVPVVEALEDAGIRCWFDVNDLSEFADSISTRIEEGITSTRLTVAFVSPGYPTRTACRWELLTTLRAAGTSEALSGLFLLDLFDLPSRKGESEWAFLSENMRMPLDVGGDRNASLDRIIDAVCSRLADAGARRLTAGGGRWWPPGAPDVSMLVGRFEERLAIFDHLSRHLGKGASQSACVAPVSIVGLGGAGKTMLALRFADDFAQHFTGGVVRLDAAGDRMGNVVADGTAVVSGVLDQVRDWIVCNAGLDKRPDPNLPDASNSKSWPAIMAAATAEVRRLPGPLLWIVDDVPDGLAPDQLALLMCPDPAIGRTLLTMRNDPVLLASAVVSVGDLDPADSMLLLREGMRGGHVASSTADVDSADEADLARLANMVEHHAMALALIAARLRSETPAEVLRSIEASEAVLARLERHREVAMPTGHNSSVRATMASSIHALGAGRVESAVADASGRSPAEPALWEGRDAAVVALRLAALLPAGLAIPLDLVAAGFLHDGAPAFDAVDAATAARDVLRRTRLAALERVADGMRVRVHALVRGVMRLPDVVGDASLPWLVPSDDELRVRSARWFHAHAESEDEWAAAEFHGYGWGLLEPMADRLGEADLIVAADCLRGTVRRPMRYPPRNLPGVQRIEVLRDLVGRAQHAEDLPTGDSRTARLSRARSMAMRGLVMSTLSETLEAQGPEEGADRVLAESFEALARAKDVREELLHESDPVDAAELDRARFCLVRPGLVAAKRAAESNPAAVARHLDGVADVYATVGEARAARLHSASPVEDVHALASCRRGLGLVDFMRATRQPGLSDGDRRRLLASAEGHVRDARELTQQIVDQQDLDTPDAAKDYELLAKIALARIALHTARGMDGPTDLATISGYLGLKELDDGAATRNSDRAVLLRNLMAHPRERS